MVATNFSTNLKESKPFLSQWEICLMELIKGVVSYKTQYRLFSEVFLALMKDELKSSLPTELPRFSRDFSSLDCSSQRYVFSFLTS